MSNAEAIAAEASEARAAPAAKFCWAASIEAEAAGASALPSDYNSSQMKRVVGLGLAPDDKIWAASATGKFYIFEPSGELVETWGGQGVGPGEFSFAIQPAQMRADIRFLPDGSFVIADVYNSRLQLFDSERRFLGQWGSGDGIRSSPRGLASTAEGELLVVFSGRSEIQRFGPEGEFRGMLDLGLRNPSALAVDTADGRIWIVDCNYEEGDNPEKPYVRVFEADGRPAFIFGKAEGGFDGLKLPSDIAFDGMGRVFVADSYHHRIAVFDRDGKYLFSFGNRGGGDGEFSYIRGLAIDSEGSLYAGDWVGGRLLKFELLEPEAAP